MTFNEYQKLAARTISDELNGEDLLYHSIFGMVAELGELYGLFQKHYQGHPIVKEHAKKELGDLLWFIAEFCTDLGWEFDEIAQMNIDKLKARYPDGFDPDKSLHRAEGDI